MSRATPPRTLRLAFQPPFDWPALVEYLGARAIPGVEAVESGVYRRSVKTGGRVATLSVRPARDGRHLLVTAGAGAGGAGERRQLRQRVRRFFDLDADPHAIRAHLSRDRRLRAGLARRPGLRVPGAWDGFELTVRAVLGQQVSVRAATTFAGRLVHACGEPLPAAVCAPALTHLFPTPERLARADLGSVGLTRTRRETLRRLAEAVAGGELHLAPGGDDAATLARLQALPGIGAWTAQYVALRVLRDPDALPAADLGLRRALAGGGPPLSAAELRERAEAWRPWRGYAAVALWMGAVE